MAMISGMFDGKKIAALLLMAGSSERFEGPIPKQFAPLGEKPLYKYPLQTMEDSQLFDEIALVCHPEWIPETRHTVIEGGKSRQESSLKGLKGLKNTPDIVLIHDAARPFVSKKILRENIQAAIEHKAVDTCIATHDTIVEARKKRWIEKIPDRNKIFRGQTPQTFDYSLLLQGHEEALEQNILNQTDDCALVLRLGKAIFIVLGEESNFKITSPQDLAFAHFLLERRAQNP